MQYAQLKKIPGVDVNDIYTGNGVSELINLCMQALLNTGDEILIPAPDYPLWTATATLSGGKVVHYICDEQSNWYPDIEDKMCIRDRKEGAQIVELLGLMGAGISLMKLENIRILKDMRNSVNRKVNCETANINKTVHAALKQAEDIRYIRDTRGLSSLPEGLEEIAELRLEFPEATLKELGMMLKPQVGKSGVNHRLRKLSEIARELKGNKEELL